MILLRYHRFSLRGVWRLWPILPFLLWVMMLTGEMVFLPNSELVQGVGLFHHRVPAGE